MSPQLGKVSMIFRRHCFRTTSLILLFIVASGCGAVQMLWHAPSIKKENWKEWGECFDNRPLSHAGIEHSVFCLEGAGSKPPVLLLHEMNGVTSETFRYAQELSADFTVYVPMLFGTKGEESVISGLWAYWFKGVIALFPSGEWGTPPTGSAPIVNWLRNVVLRMEEKHRASPIRIIGNCMTGALPLALLDNANVDAVVVAQPALPMKFFSWYTSEDEASLGLSPEDWRVAKERSQAKVLALRFETDWISPPAKYEALRDGLRKRFVDEEICGCEYLSGGELVRPHSTLIGGRDAVGRVGAMSKRKREEVRKFLFSPHVAIENSYCRER